MSIDIDWATLTTGPSGLALADSIRDFIHDKFQQVTLPRFIRSVHVHSFDFGDECPVVELKDISDPLPDFYEEDDDDEEEGGEEEEEGESSPEDAKEQAISEAAPNRPSSSLHPSNRAPTTTATKTMNPPPLYTARPRNLHLNLPFTPTTDQISTPFLSRSTTTTPGVPIPGRTSNFSYFHLPLSAGLSGAQTPLSHPHSEHPQPSSSNSPYRRTHPPPPPPQPPFPSFSPSFSPSSSSTTTTTSSSSSGNQDDRTLDLQTTLHITYAGSLSLSLTAEILLDYPMPSFVGIPLKLQITGLSFDGVALVAYLRGRGGGGDGGGGGGDDGGDGGEGGEVSGRSSGQKKKRKRKGRRDVVHFCFLGREDAGLVVGERAAASHLDGGDGNGNSKCDGKGHGQGEEATPKGGGLLREIRVESEIGRQEGGKQVLKNVGKVEKFVLEQVRRIVEEEFVWPSFWTFLV